MLIDPKFINNNIARWEKFSFSYTDFSAASTTNDLLVVTVPIEGIVSEAVIKSTLQFAGTGITTVTASLGSTTQGTACLGTLELASNPVSGTNYVFTNFTPTTGLWSGDFTTSDGVRIYATADGLLNLLTFGEVEVWLKTEVIPAP
jgi:hypothetical protein